MANNKPIDLSPKERFFGEYYSNHNKYPVCPICNEEIQRANLDTAEYIKTKTGSELFVHRTCMFRKKV